MSNIIEHQKISAIVENYQLAQAEVKQAFDLLMSAKKRLYATLGQYHDTIFRDRISDYHLDDQAKESAKIIRRNAWRYLLEQLQIRNVMSIEAKKKLDEQIEKGDLPELTVESALAAFNGFMGMAEVYLEDAVQEVFNWLRPRHERYKTNQKYQIGKKVIIGWAISYNSISFHREQEFRALDNVFHMLDGKGCPKYPNDLVSTVNNAIREKKTSCETPYFSCKWYLKGTIHITFKRPDLLKRLNRKGGNYYNVGQDEGKRKGTGKADKGSEALAKMGLM